MGAVTAAPGTTLNEAFAHVSRRSPDSEAIIAGAIRIAYGALATLVEDCARSLVRHGVRPGDRVGILAPPRPEALIVLLACSRIGAIYLGLGTRLMPGELAYVLADAQPRLVFAVRRFDMRDLGADAAAACRDAGVAHCCLMTLDENRLAPEFQELLQDAGTAEPVVLPAPPRPDDGVAIIYTSGTTGPPKGALISHRGLIAAVTGVLPRLRLSRVRALSVLPIDHVGFLANEAAKVILTGGTAIQLTRFDAIKVLETIEQHRVTLWCAIPTMLQRLVASRQMDNHDLSSLELVWWPGPLPRHVIAAFRRKSRRLGVSYGMTEASGGVTFSDPDITDDLLFDTVGPPHDFIEVRLSQEAPMGEDGPREILIRGPQLMLGYWNKPTETARAFVDGWFRTGDLGIMRDGMLRVVGRQKELIRTGGYNVSPTEVEKVIEAMPGVGFVVVLGIPDEDYGEAVHAVWCPAPDAVVSDGELERHVRKHLAGYKVPKRFWCRRELPFLANGKLDRKELHRQIAEACASINVRRA